MVMANSPIDKIPEVMKEVTGATVLITDPAADRLLAKAAKEKATQRKFTEFCGGKGGWSDYTERWH